jgi:hypothetical protein
MEMSPVARKKQPVTPKEAGRKTNKNMVRVSDEDYAMLTELANRHGRKITAENRQALLDYFRKHKMLPPEKPA